MKKQKHLNNLNFGQAIEALKDGKMVARSGWNGKGMFIVLIRAGNAIYKKLGSGSWPMKDCIGLKNANHEMQPGWNASQEDMLAEDWQVIE